MADPVVSAADRKFLSTLRSLETGDPTALTGENYRKHSRSDSGDAYGADQFTSITLQQIGAIKNRHTPVTESSNWTGAYGNDLNDFLDNPDNQDKAAIKYANYLIKNDIPDDVIGSTIDRHRVTWEGAVYAAWHSPEDAVNALNEAPYRKKILNDLGNRLRAGETVQNELTAPHHSRRQTFLSDPSSVSLFQPASYTFQSESEETESRHHDAALKEEEEQLRQIFLEIEILRELVNSGDPSLNPDEILDALNSLIDDMEGYNLTGNALLDQRRSSTAYISDWIELAYDKTSYSQLDEDNSWDEQQEDAQSQAYSFEEPGFDDDGGNLPPDPEAEEEDSA